MYYVIFNRPLVIRYGCSVLHVVKFKFPFSHDFRLNLKKISKSPSSFSFQMLLRSSSISILVKIERESCDGSWGTEGLRDSWCGESCCLPTVVIARRSRNVENVKCFQAIQTKIRQTTNSSYVLTSKLPRLVTIEYAAHLIATIDLNGSEPFQFIFIMSFSRALSCHDHRGMMSLSQRAR